MPPCTSSLARVRRRGRTRTVRDGRPANADDRRPARGDAGRRRRDVLVLVHDGARQRVRQTLRHGQGDDSGNAVVEFLGLSLMLLVPLVYLVLVLARVEAAGYAVEGAAREAARTYVAADDAQSAAARAVAVTGVALADQGFDDDPAQALTLECEHDPCLQPDAHVEARVQVVVPLPFVPGFVRDVVPMNVPVSARHTAVVDEFRSTG